MLCNAKLEGAYMRFSNLKKADLSGANLQGADLRKAVLKKAIFDETTNLLGVKVDNANWFDNLTRNDCIGVEDVNVRYQVAQRPTEPPIFIVEQKVIEG
jgi:uncharacterized protein YjbI with pentapeptide repeats